MKQRKKKIPKYFWKIWICWNIYNKHTKNISLLNFQSSNTSEFIFEDFLKFNIFQKIEFLLNLNTLNEYKKFLDCIFEIN